MMTQGSVGGQLVGAQESLLRLTQIIKPELVAQVLSACKKNQTSPRGGHTKDSQGAYPQVGKMSLVELGTHVELAIHLRANWQGEQTIAYRMTKHLQPGDMLLMDAGIFCYRMAKQTKTQNAEFLARSQMRTHVRRTENTSGSPSPTQAHASPQPKSCGSRTRVVRAVNCTLLGSQSDGRSSTSGFNRCQSSILQWRNTYHPLPPA